MNKSLKVLLLRLGGVALFFSLSLFLTNFFPTDEVGKYDFTRSVLLIIGGLCLLGTDQSIIYFSGVLSTDNNLGDLRKVYKKMLAIIASTSIFILLVFLLIPNALLNTFFEKEDASTLFLQAILTLGAFTLTLLNIDTLRGLGKTFFSEVYRNIYRHGTFFLFAIVLFLVDKVNWLSETFLVTFVFLAVLSSIRVYLVFQEYPSTKLSSVFSYKDILTRSYPMALSSVSYFLMQSIDIILLGKFMDFETVAFYAVAVKVATVTSLAQLSIGVVMAPKIAELYTKGDKDALRKLINKSSRLILLLSIPAIAILFGFSEFILSLFGDEFVAAKGPLRILLLAQLVKSLSGPIAIYMNMTGSQKKLHQILFVGLVLNIILNWFLIPIYGMQGAAYATAASIVLWNALAVVYVYFKDKIRTFIS